MDAVASLAGPWALSSKKWLKNEFLCAFKEYPSSNKLCHEDPTDPLATFCGQGGSVGPRY